MTCTKPALAEVELLHDGRLTPLAAQELERHLATCEVCSKEKDALEQLAAQFRKTGSPQDEVLLRRLRSEVLAAARSSAARRTQDRFRQELNGPRTRMGWKLAAATAALASLLSIGFLVITRHSASTTQAVEIVVQPEAATEWERTETPGRSVLTLHAGALTIATRHATGVSALLVRVPDGELEDVGTAFRVRVVRGHTVEISVSEGEVVFRRPGAAVVHLAAPVTWRSEHELPSKQTAAAHEDMPAQPATPQRARDGVAPDSGAAARVDMHTPTHPGSDAPRVHATARAAATTTATAVNAADEDTLYLQIVALLREKRRDEAHLAARRYLDTYPNGFRRAEVSAALGL